MKEREGKGDGRRHTACHAWGRRWRAEVAGDGGGSSDDGGEGAHDSGGGLDFLMGWCRRWRGGRGRRRVAGDSVKDPALRGMEPDGELPARRGKWVPVTWVTTATTMSGREGGGGDESRCGVADGEKWRVAAVRGGEGGDLVSGGAGGDGVMPMERRVFDLGFSGVGGRRRWGEEGSVGLSGRKEMQREGAEGGRSVREFRKLVSGGFRKRNREGEVGD